MPVAVQTFADRLAAEVERKRSQLVVGLDPRVELLPVELRGDIGRFCCGLIDAVAPHAVAVKPQLAFFETLGAPGMAAFEVFTSTNNPAPLRRAAARNGSIDSRPRYGLTVRASARGSSPSMYASAYARAVEPMSPRLPSAITSSPARRA